MKREREPETLFKIMGLLGIKPRHVFLLFIVTILLILIFAVGCQTPATPTPKARIGLSLFSPTVTTIVRGTQDVAVLLFTIQTSSEPVKIDKVVVARRGNLPDSDISAVKLFFSYNQLGKAQVFDPFSQQIVFPNINLEIPPYSSYSLVIRASIKATAAPGATIQFLLSVAPEANLSFSGTFPIEGNFFRIIVATSPIPVRSI